MKREELLLGESIFKCLVTVIEVIFTFISESQSPFDRVSHGQCA